MIRYLEELANDQHRHELSLLVGLQSSITNFSPRGAALTSRRFRRTFFLDQGFCNSLGYEELSDRTAIGLPSARRDFDVFELFSKVQSYAGFIVEPYSFLFLVLRSGDHASRDSTVIALALPMPAQRIKHLMKTGRLSFVRMGADGRYSPAEELGVSSFDIEVRKDRHIFWER